MSACKVDTEPIAYARSAEYQDRGIIITTVFCVGECDGQIARSATNKSLIVANDGDYVWTATHYCHHLDKCVVDIL